MRWCTHTHSYKGLNPSFNEFQVVLEFWQSFVVQRRGMTTSVMMARRAYGIIRLELCVLGKIRMTLWDGENRDGEIHRRRRTLHDSILSCTSSPTMHRGTWYDCSRASHTKWTMY